MDTKIRLNKTNSLQEGNKNVSLKVDLSNNKLPLLEDEIVDVVDEYSQYLLERESCNKIRLTTQINIIASNVLFNGITEIVKKEGSNESVCLNFNQNSIISGVLGKDSRYFHESKTVLGNKTSNCMRDTQITSKKHGGFVYLPGLDIFNNHILRSRITTPIIFSSGDTLNSMVFNTLEDYVRECLVPEDYVLYKTDTESEPYGKKELSCAFSGVANKWIHMYTKSDVPSVSLLQSLNENLQEKNGWFGFLNKTKMLSCNLQGEDIDVAKVINYEQTNKFIEMYPNHSHYDFLPHYNKERRRKEKNWEYCLCYPYSSTTENIPCIDTNGRIKILFVSENESDYDGLLKTMVVSSCKHGLSMGDTLNIYNQDGDAIIQNVVVDTILDEYSFYVYLGEDINDEQKLTFCRTVNNKECKYYVRIFSRMPNFEFMDGVINEGTIYQECNGITPVEEYAKPQYEHQSIASRLSYAKNIYNDNIHQIVYTDDIYFNNLHDNLGRPLTILYLCFYKTNYGHKQWYNGNVTDSRVEHSHCFGKLNCGLELALDADLYGYTSGNTRVMNNISEGYNGLDQTILRGHVDGVEDDEILFKEMNLFYGDLCEYSEFECKEKILQPIIHRFNTQQRELDGSNLSTRNDLTGNIEFDSIIYDDYETNDNMFTLSSYTIDYNALAQKEGYVYQSAYEIPLRSWSSQIKTFKPLDLGLYDITESNGIYTITTSTPHKINKDFKIALHDIVNKKHYMCVIEDIVSSNVFTCSISEKFGNIPDFSDGINGFRLYKAPDTIPDYVTLSDDEDGVYRWRYLLENGFEETDGIIEEYPFTNNCLYVNKAINLYVKRQDPFGENGLSEPLSEILVGVRSEAELTDAYTTFKERDTIC